MWVFHGDSDYDMATRPVSAEWVRELVPHAQVMIIPQCGHTLSVGPNQDTRNRFAATLAYIGRRNSSVCSQPHHKPPRLSQDSSLSLSGHNYSAGIY